jgi:hypothetical protein
VREEAREILFELGEEWGVDVAEAQVVASNLAARELQSITERDTTGVIVVGSTSRGPVGRLLPEESATSLGRLCLPRGYRAARVRRAPRGVASPDRRSL